MGRQTTMARSTLLKRMILVVTVAALMTAMRAVSAMPAFALPGQPSPHGPTPISQGVENACAQKVGLSLCG